MTALRDNIAREPLLRPLLKKGALMRRLEELVAGYSPGGPWWIARPLVELQWTAVAPKGRALARALDDVEALMTSEPLATLLALSDGREVAGLTAPEAFQAATLRACGGLQQWLAALRELRQHSHALGGLDHRPGRGNTPDAFRDRFCVEVAEALIDANVRPTTQREGGFALVLRAALEAAERIPPQDLRPLVVKAIETLEAEGKLQRRA